MLCEERFYEIYGKDAEGVSFSPYRICPIGAHSDHNLGKITGLALDKGIHIAFRPKQNGVIEMQSLQFPKRAQWHIRDVGEKTGDWADYLRGATWALNRDHRLSVGVCGVIEGSLPIGGLSSSAAVILAFLDALCKVNSIKLPPQELIDVAFRAEKNYVGVNVGTLDQSCEVLGKKDHLLYLDCKDNHFELIPTNPRMKPYQIAIFFSGLEHSLAGSKYNMRVDELRAGVYALQAFAGLRRTKTSCLRPGPNAANTGIPNFSGSKPAPKPGAAATWKAMADSASSPAGAASTTGNPAPLSRSASMKSCGKPTASTADVSAEPASKAAVWP